MKLVSKPELNKLYTETSKDLSIGGKLNEYIPNDRTAIRYFVILMFLMALFIILFVSVRNFSGNLIFLKTFVSIIFYTLLILTVIFTPLYFLQSSQAIDEFSAYNDVYRAYNILSQDIDQINAEQCRRASSLLRSYYSNSSLIANAKREFLFHHYPEKFYSYSANISKNGFVFNFQAWVNYQMLLNLIWAVIKYKKVQLEDVEFYLKLTRIFATLELLNIKYPDDIDRKNEAFNEIQNLYSASEEKIKKITDERYLDHEDKSKVEYPNARELVKLIKDCIRIVQASLQSKNLFLGLVSWYILIQILALISMYIWCSIHSVNIDSKVVAALMSIPFAGAFAVRAIWIHESRK